MIMQILSFDTETSVSELVERRLRESPYFFLRGVQCHFAAGVLTLRGTVPLWQLRQFAESIARRVQGVRSVDNQVEVFDPVTMPFSGRAVRTAG